MLEPTQLDALWMWMAAHALIVAFWLFGVGLLLALLRLSPVARWLIVLGALAGIWGAISDLPAGGGVFQLPLSFADQPIRLHYAPEALWLLGFGLLPAAIAAALCTPIRHARRGWLVGVALSLIGALGVFGLQDGYSFLIAWELMSVGGAVMILAEHTSSETGRAALYMLALLEVGAVAILLAVLLLGQAGGGTLDFGRFAAGALSLPAGMRIFIGLLVLFGFGAKLGLLPFYEWFPKAYASGSGATGAILSGVVLNAAFFALSRALEDWMPATGGVFALGVITTVIGMLSSTLTALYAFQQDDWRRLLSFSSAENASIAVTTLGASLLFKADGQPALAGLAWTVAILHLSGHALAKSGLFLSADGVYAASGGYRIAQHGWLRTTSILFAIGALFATMSLAALPPQIGFVTEWFTFQTVFQGFHLSTLAGRLTLALAGAGLALTAAVAFATFVKAFGVGLLGDGHRRQGPHIGGGYDAGVFVLGVAVLAAAVGLPVWLQGLDAATQAHFGTAISQSMHSGWLLVPLTGKFSFISPSKLVIAMPLLAILPLLLLINARRFAVRKAPVWYGGMHEDPDKAATTSLTFANALRTFYSFIYRPTLDTTREHQAVAYFVRRLELNHDVADVFGPSLFTPIRRAVWRLGGVFRALQSGDLNVYLSLIGLLLLLIFGLTLY